MAEFRISCTVRFANGAPAPNIEVVVHEGSRDYRPGRTGADGRIEGVLRQRQRVRILFVEVDNLFDNPSFTMTLSANAQTMTTALASDVTLPPDFGPHDPPATPTTSNAATTTVDTQDQMSIGGGVPGYAHVFRKDGALWIDATRGLRVVRAPGQRARAMTRDTIVHLASMSKPFGATATAAMIDDWRNIADEVARIAAGTAPQARLVLERRFLFWRRRMTIDVPTVLVPLFFEPSRADQFMQQSLLTNVPARVRDHLSAVIYQSWRVATPRSPAMPGYFGFLRRVLRGESVASFESPFLPFIRDELGPGPLGQGAEKITIADLCAHRTTFRSRDYDRSRVSAEEISSVAQNEPADGSRATVDYWGQTALLLRGDHGTQDRDYSNWNYTVLTTVIEACTEESYDTYVNRRLFFDSRFDRIRRHVAVPEEASLYHNGPGNGVPLPDYTGWPANGGHYASAAQLTRWLYFLYARQPVASAAGGTAPLISLEAHESLFNTDKLFAGGISAQIADPSDPSAGSTIEYSHNGGTSPVPGGSVNGRIGIYVNPSGAVITAALLLNGPGGADGPYYAALSAIAADLAAP